MIKVTKRMSIELDIEESDAVDLLNHMKNPAGNVSEPPHIARDLIATLTKALSRIKEGPVYREKS